MAVRSSRRPAMAVNTSLPPGAGPPINPSPSARHTSAYPFQMMVHPDSFPNPWEESSSASPTTPTNVTDPGPSRPPSRSASAALISAPSTSLAFPEPQIYRSVSTSSFGHRQTRSDLGPNPTNGITLHRDPSSISVWSSNSNAYYEPDETSISEDSHGTEEITQQVADIDLASEDGIIQFQKGNLPERDQDWYRLVPKEALEALPRSEVQRQSVIFELIKTERDYINDLETILDVYIRPLRKISPPIIAPNALPGFIEQVFGNVSSLVGHHQRMLGALFSRQRETHPLVQSIADIVLDAVLNPSFRSDYEAYVKHYPLAESHHRKEMNRNPDYSHFILSSSNDPRVRKRDLITFLSRPVTRLPRLNLLLEQILKLTDKEYEHPDLETLPIILGILSDFIKSTQPGIEAAESKVKFWALCETLLFRKGEIIDMDLYNERRTLIYQGNVYRRLSRDHSLTEITLSLLDHYVLITQQKKGRDGMLKNELISRPIPLSFLRLGAFENPSSLHRDPNKDCTAGIMLSRRSTPFYPFTIYHGFSVVDRQYTLYVASESIRKKWKKVLVEAMAVNKSYEESNMLYEPTQITDQFFRHQSPKMQPGMASDLTGKINVAVPFVSLGRKFIAVGCQRGIFVSPRGKESFRRVLAYSNPTSIAAVQSVGKKVFNKFLVLYEGTLISYSLDILARVGLGEAQPKLLDASREPVAGHDANVMFFKQAHVNGRVLIIYATRKVLQSSLNMNVLEVVDTSEVSMTPQRINGRTVRSFRPFGEPGYVPKDAYDISPLAKTIGICTADGILIVDPSNIAKSHTVLVPDLREANAGSNKPMMELQSRIQRDEAKPLGLLRVSDSELLVVFNKLGVFITRHGQPSRNSGFVRWETDAVSMASRGAYVFLFSFQFVEIRNIATGTLAQVIDNMDVRLLFSGVGMGAEDTMLYAAKGAKDDKYGFSDRVTELVETRVISASRPRRPNRSSSSSANVPEMWAEWDM